MSLLYAIAWLCDAMLYFGVLGLLGLLWRGPAWLFAAPLVLALGCAAGYRLREKGRLWLIPGIAAGLVALLLMDSNPARLVCLPPAAYLLFYMQANRTVTDHYYAAGRFRRGMLALPIAAFLASQLQSPWSQGLPYLFAYFSLTVFLLRLLRADDSAAASLRFRLMNLISIAGVCAAGFALSQPPVLAALGAGARFAANRVLAPVASALLYAIGWVLYLVARLLSLLAPKDTAVPVMPEFQAMESLEEAYLPPERGGAVVSPLARALLIAIFAILAAGITLALLRLLARQTARLGGSEAADEREALRDEEALPRPPRLRARGGDAGEGVRYWYLRQLRLLKARGGQVSPTMDTRQLRDENAPSFDPGALDALRALYLPARYGGRDASEADARAAREAYARLRDHRRDG